MCFICEIKSGKGNSFGRTESFSHTRTAANTLLQTFDPLPGTSKLHGYIKRRDFDFGMASRCGCFRHAVEIVRFYAKAKALSDRTMNGPPPAMMILHIHDCPSAV